MAGSPAWASAWLLTLLLSGCSLGKDLYNTPLPGGADVGDHPLEITADFDDVVDLVPQSSVKVENIAVGRVSSIELNPDGRSARVTLVVRRDVDLPQGTTARLQQTSLLGEKYVALIRPSDPEPGAASLQSGANIPIGGTSQVAEVEQVLGALSLVVNGGGLAKFQDISRELQQVSSGRPEEIRAFLSNMETFMTSLDARKGAITAALDSVARLSTTLDNDKAKIAEALEGLSPGLQVLADQRGQLVDMLEALDELSDVSVKTLDASQKDIVRGHGAARADPAGAGRVGRRTAELARAAAHLPVPGLGAGGDQGRLPQRVRDRQLHLAAGQLHRPRLCVAAVPRHRGRPTGGSPHRLGTPTPRPRRHSPTAASATGSVGPSVDPQPASSPSHPAGSPSPTGSVSPSVDPQPAGSPSPTLLPPTDSALPGLPEPSVQVPSPSATTESSPTTGEED